MRLVDFPPLWVIHLCMFLKLTCFALSPSVQIVRIKSMTKQRKEGPTLGVTMSPCSTKIIMTVGVLALQESTLLFILMIGLPLDISPKGNYLHFPSWLGLCFSDSLSLKLLGRTQWKQEEWQIQMRIWISFLLFSCSWIAQEEQRETLFLACEPSGWPVHYKINPEQSCPELRFLLTQKSCLQRLLALSPALIPHPHPVSRQFYLQTFLS